ncbi:MAG: hypothetical protein R3207_06755, partial [Oceanospirillum sp.]|nr:hypothetical protein [Oceanospirillum sp.]
MVDLMRAGMRRMALMLALVVFSGVSYAASIADEVRDVVEENIAATQSEDMARMMKTIHSSSPS